MHRITLLLLALLLGASANPLLARDLTDIKGRSIDVDVILITETTVTVRRSSDGSQFEIPLENLTIADREALKREHEKLGTNNSFTPKNEALGIELWADTLIWDDAPANIAARLGWQLEYQTQKLACYRHYFPKDAPLIAGARPYAAALFVIDGKVDYLSITFANSLDSTTASSHSKRIAEVKRGIGKAIRLDQKAIEKCLNSLTRKLNHKREHADEKSDFNRWDIQHCSFILHTKEEQYINLQIMPAKLADWFERSDKRKLANSMIRPTPASDGPIVLTDLPEVSPGPKQLQLAATAEAFLRHSNIRADMYLLAMHLDNEDATTPRTEKIFNAAKQFAIQDGDTPIPTDLAIRKIDSRILFQRTVLCALKPLPELTPKEQRPSDDPNQEQINGHTLTQRSTNHSENNTPNFFIITGYNPQNQTLALTSAASGYKVHWVNEALVKSVDSRQNHYFYPHYR
ncbi:MULTISPECIES: hypothetical protein [unclassified Lentimonas]|uniref:hypothetical protein n=1 Tax=unclassified Lentimonas TaxID=2630993 RepID=UPI00132B3DE1|nr:MULTISPECIES: hypothetical protein [unclassified Lentimonas]CAA6691243.1 Unannotated [Lentimonas sp. CC19]CAA6694843.1 Unannotated [Lentimonas sp. CC10]CAA7071620.1 Unannotated [Lentimonas sp. CC11]